MAFARHPVSAAVIVVIGQIKVDNVHRFAFKIVGMRNAWLPIPVNVFQALRNFTPRMFVNLTVPKDVRMAYASNPMSVNAIKDTI